LIEKSINKNGKGRHVTIKKCNKESGESSISAVYVNN